MTQSNQNQNSQATQQKYFISLEQKLDKLGSFSLNLLRTIVLWRLLGYVLLFLFLMDMADIFIPLNFLNAQWEFNALGQIIERIPIPMLAFVLIFNGGQYLRKNWENWFLKFASWLTLIIGVFLILTVPLGIINTIRIDTQTQQNITEQTNQRVEFLQTLESKLEEVTNKEQMQVLVTQLNGGISPILENQEQLEDTKTNIQQLINSNREELKIQTNITKKESRQSLLKRSVKWNIGALISGSLFIMFWKMTKWARQGDSLNNI